MRGSNGAVANRCVGIRSNASTRHVQRRSASAGEQNVADFRCANGPSARSRARQLIDIAVLEARAAAADEGLHSTAPRRQGTISDTEGARVAIRAWLQDCPRGCLLAVFVLEGAEAVRSSEPTQTPKGRFMLTVRQRNASAPSTVVGRTDEIEQALVAAPRLASAVQRYGDLEVRAGWVSLASRHRRSPSSLLRVAASEWSRVPVGELDLATARRLASPWQPIARAGQQAVTVRRSPLARQHRRLESERTHQRRRAPASARASQSAAVRARLRIIGTREQLSLVRVISSTLTRARRRCTASKPNASGVRAPPGAPPHPWLKMGDLPPQLSAKRLPSSACLWVLPIDAAADQPQRRRRRAGGRRYRRSRHGTWRRAVPVPIHRGAHPAAPGLAPKRPDRTSA